jgi:drug/metabolite transporter (DMT)-like permease
VPERRPSTTQLLAAFAAVYFIWGSTYLFIRYAIQTIPPFLMASGRFLCGGMLLYGWSRWEGTPPATSPGWRHAFILGGLLFLFGNGGVVTAEQWVPSGLTAVLVATVPLWVAVVTWMVPGGRRPSDQVAVGIVLGLCGVALLIGVGNLRQAGTVDPAGAAILLFSSLSWACGSVYAQRNHVSDSPLQASGMQMIGGGVFLLVAGLVAGEFSKFEPARISLTSLGAVIYLAIFGSIVAFTAYSWLLKATTPSRAATYAYVNPAVAVLLGWAIAGEPLTARMVLAMCVIVAAVMVITLSKQH